MPELSGKPAVELLFDIYHKGISSDENEVPVRLRRNRQTETRYFNFSYRPLKDGEHITCVTDVAVEATASIGKAGHRPGEQLRSSIDSAKLATWDINVDTGTHIPSVRPIGYDPGDYMPLDVAYEQITGSYRETVRQAVEIRSNGCGLQHRVPGGRASRQKSALGPCARKVANLGIY